MANSNIIIETKWQKRETDCRTCSMCESIIVTTMWQCVAKQINVESKGTVVCGICDNCYEATIKDC